MKTDRKSLSLAVKLNVIWRTEEAGERQTLGLSGSTVHVLKNEDKIKEENGKKRAKVQLSLDSFL
jgi:hypothetical protein